MYTQDCSDCVALNTYYNGKNNILTTSQPPPLPGQPPYQFVRTEGYARVNSTAISGNLTALNMWYNAAMGDTWLIG